MNKNLANLFIVGAAKCGTTSLYEYLSQHPQIYMCPVKEPHFFSDKVENLNNELYEQPKKGVKYHSKIIKDPDVYQSLFDEGAGFNIRGEASPSYLWDPDSALKIFNYNPNAKIIVVLRNPIDRLVSGYQMDHSLGLQAGTDFLTNIKEEFKKEKKIWGIDRIYLDLGFYYEQISRYKKLFPDDQILIIKFDNLVKKTSETLVNVFKFLKVDEKYLANINLGEVHNESATIKYPFLKKLKKVKVFRSVMQFVNKRFKFLKKLTHKKGYGLQLSIDDKAKAYLNDVYSNDLAKLKNEYHIEF